MIQRKTEMLKRIYRRVIPSHLRAKISLHRNNQQKNIVKFLEQELKNNPDSEKEEIVNFLKRNSLTMFPYDFIRKYESENIAVYTDTSCDMRYILYDNKRLYFRKDWDEKKIQDAHKWLSYDQDIDSPHRYEYADFVVQNGDIVVDAGAAEGNFALSVVERVKKLYLFECEQEWIEALEMTFAPWKEKVVIVNKYISDTNDNNSITLDDFLKGEKINFLKADIEGAELQLLNGGRNTLSTGNNLRVAICTYHKQSDAEDLNNFLIELGFHTEFSKGYLIYTLDKSFSPPYLRRGLIRAVKI
jgi:hypothetical protein